MGIFLLFIIIFCWISFDRMYNRVWSDQKIYCHFWLKHDPQMQNSIYRYLALPYEWEGDYESARKYLRLSLSGTLSDAGVYNNLGFCDQSSGMYTEAEYDYKKALTIDPYSIYAYIGLGNIYLKQGQKVKARQDFEEALTLNPHLEVAKWGLEKLDKN